MSSYDYYVRPVYDETITHRLEEHIANKDIHFTKEDLDLAYVKAEDLVNYALKSDFDKYYTKTQIDGKGYITTIPSYYVTETELAAALKGITPGSGSGNVDLSNYYTKDQVNSLINGASGSTVVNSVVTGLSLSNGKLTLTQTTGNSYTVDLSKLSASIGVSYLDKTSSNATGRYQLGTLTIGTTDINIYGIDTTGGSSTGGSSTGGNTGGTTVKSFNVSVYIAVAKTVSTVTKPDNAEFNTSTGEFVSYPSGWYASPKLAIDAYKSNNCQIWVSHNNYLSNGTNTGWTNPVKYFDVDQIISDAKDEAQQYYKQQLTDASSELNNTIQVAKSTLSSAKELLESVKKGDVSSLYVDVATTKSSIKDYGWSVDTDNNTVKYCEKLLDAAEGRIIESVSNSNTVDGTVKKAIQDMMAEYIKFYVYDYATNGPINESYLKLTATQALLSALGGTDKNNDGIILPSEVKSAVLDIVKDKIALAVANGTNGVSLSLGFDKDGNGNIVGDATTTVFTGQVIADSLASNDVTISKGAASIQGDGSAYFGNSTTEFKADGSGHTAGGNISWDINGKTKFNGDIIANSFKAINGDTSMLLSIWDNISYSNPTDAAGNSITIPTGAPVFVITCNSDKYVVPIYSVSSTSTEVSFTANNYYVLDSDFESPEDSTNILLRLCTISSNQSFASGKLYKTDNSLFSGKIIYIGELEITYSDLVSDATTEKGSAITSTDTNVNILTYFAQYNETKYDVSSKINTLSSIYANQNSYALSVCYFMYDVYTAGVKGDRYMYFYTK